MRKLFVLFAAFTLLAFTVPAARAQMMGTTSAAGGDDHTAREEAEGKAVWEKLQAKQVSCADLSEDDYGALGEFFMGQRMGAAHAAVNEQMERMMGEAGEEQMHVALGKRVSGCDQAAPFPTQGTVFMPMMSMMMGAGMMGAGGGMMGAGPGGGMMGGGTPGGGIDDGWLGWGGKFKPGGMMAAGSGRWWLATGVSFVWWALISLVLVALARWLWLSAASPRREPTALEALQQRYARGEISRAEFDEKKKDLA